MRSYSGNSTYDVMWTNRPTAPGLVKTANNAVYPLSTTNNKTLFPPVIQITVLWSTTLVLTLLYLIYLYLD